MVNIFIYRRFVELLHVLILATNEPVEAVNVNFIYSNMFSTFLHSISRTKDGSSTYPCFRLKIFHSVKVFYFLKCVTWLLEPIGIINGELNGVKTVKYVTSLKGQ